MRIKFLSLASAQHAFAFDSQAFDMKAAVSARFRMFDTYGDGLTQHSGDWAITREHLTDYLASLATYLIQAPADEETGEFLQTLGYMLSGPNQVDIRFAATVVFKPSAEGSSYEAKPRFYSREERKVSAVASKQYDKRYDLITPAEDGSPAAIFRMLLPSCPGDLDRLLYAEAIRDWTLTTTGAPFMPMAAEFLEWFDGDRARDLRYALSACRSLAESYRLRCNAESELGNIRAMAERLTQLAADREVGETQVVVEVN